MNNDDYVSKKQIEKITKHQRLLLRAAYIASFMETSDNFPHGLEKRFSSLKQWPVSIPREEDQNESEKKMVASINEWFETNLVRNMIQDISHPDKLQKVYELIEKAVVLPKLENKLIPYWLQRETIKLADKAINKQVEDLIKKRR